MFACDSDKLEVWNAENLDISVSFGCEEGGKDSSWVLEKKRPVEEVGDGEKDSVEEIVVGCLNYVRDGCSASTGLVIECHGLGEDGPDGGIEAVKYDVTVSLTNPSYIIPNIPSRVARPFEFDGVRLEQRWPA